MSDKAEQLFTVNMVLGTVERQERPVLDGNRVGYKWRNVTIDKRGVAIDIGPWNPPLCWMEFPVSTDISVGRAPVALQRFGEAWPNRSFHRRASGAPVLVALARSRRSLHWSSRWLPLNAKLTCPPRVG